MTKRENWIRSSTGLEWYVEERRHYNFDYTESYKRFIYHRKGSDRVVIKDINKEGNATINEYPEDILHI